MTSNGSMSNLIVGAGGLLGAKADDICGDDSSFQTCCCNSGIGESEKEKYIDPGLRKDFLAWKKDPSFDRGTSDFLERLYREDIDLCLVKIHFLVETSILRVSYLLSWHLISSL